MQKKQKNPTQNTLATAQQLPANHPECLINTATQYTF